MEITEVYDRDTQRDRDRKRWDTEVETTGGRVRCSEKTQCEKTESWSQAYLGLNSANFWPLEVEVLEKFPHL